MKRGLRIQALPGDWRKVIDYIERPGNLDKMKAIIGSLGKYADQVWFGGLTAKDIGDVIGTGPPVVSAAPKAEEKDYCKHPISEVNAMPCHPELKMAD